MTEMFSSLPNPIQKLFVILVVAVGLLVIGWLEYIEQKWGE